MGAEMVSTAGETARVGRGGVTQNVTFNLPGKYDMRTLAQISSDYSTATARDDSCRTRRSPS